MAEIKDYVYKAVDAILEKKLKDYHLLPIIL